MASLDDFLIALCQRMGWEPTTWRLNVLKEMARQEGNVDHLAEMWNPLSTTMPAGGAKDWNSVGVKIYPDMATGVEATALTLEQEGYYPGLLATMEAQSPQSGVEQGLKTWGWQDAGRLSPAGQQILNVMGGTTGQGGTMAKPTQSADVTAATTTPTSNATGSFVQWLVDNGWGPSFVDEDPKTGELSLWKNPPQYLYDEWKAETGQGTSGLAPEEAAYKTVQTAKIEQELADYPRLVSMDEREQKRKEIETEISAGTLEWNKGVDKFNAWLNATGEARMRAEKEMEQKEWQLPTKYFPGTEPGGMLAKVSEGYGLPFTPLEGQPVTPESSAEGVYNKWQGNMGAPLQAPSFPGNGGSATPTDAMGGAATQLAGPSETQNFIQELLRKHALRVGGLPGMAGGGFMPEHRPFIAGERGPEVIQPTNTGTAVTPIVGPGGENPESMAQQYRPDYGRLLENHYRRRSQVYQRWQASGRF
jgi:hypothetical protein